MLSIALLCTSLSSAALTIGRLQGQAILGKPLDVQVQIIFDGMEDNSECLAADVSYGDAPLAASQVSVRLETGVSSVSASSTVRISSSVPVNEPIVALNLRSGCRQKTSRQFTLFTELPTARSPQPLALNTGPVTLALTSTSAAGLPPTLASPPVAPVSPAAATPRAAPERLARETPKKIPRESVASIYAAVIPAVVSSSPPTKVATPRKTDNRSRLRLDPLDLTLERDPVLRTSNELLTLPQEEVTPERAQAAAWWRALNLSPEDALRDAQRLESFQTNIVALQTIAANNQKSLAELSERVQRAQSEKYANGLVYSLLALCALGLAAIVFLWQRLRQVQAPSWSQGHDASDSILVYADPGPESNATPPSPEKPPATAPTPPHASPATPAVDLDLDLTQAAPSARPLQREFPSSAFPNSRSMDSEELLDIRQKADFFLALDQHDKAIELLSPRVAQCGESSPLICLDLLKIYHSLGRKQDFDILRTEFNHWFTGRVPEFSSFLNEGRALSSYPSVLNHITELWPAPSVLDYIERTIYQHSSTQADANFDLQAYRELLLLHSIAKRIMRLAHGNDNEHPSEFIRIPACAASQNADDSQGVSDSRGATHRAGAHLRGMWNPDTKQDNLNSGPDTQPSASALGAMRVPVHVVQPLDLELELEPTEPKNRTTDFNFLNLR